jgi:hypothetical protein
LVNLVLEERFDGAWVEECGEREREREGEGEGEREGESVG